MIAQCSDIIIIELEVNFIWVRAVHQDRNLGITVELSGCLVHS